MEKCNIKITIIIDDLDKPGDDPIKLIDNMKINGLYYDFSRSVQKKYLPGEYTPELIHGGGSW